MTRRGVPRSGAVIDASVLVFLLHLDLLPNLVIRYDVIYVPRYVLDEVARKGRARYRLRSVLKKYSFFEKCSVSDDISVRLLSDRALNPDARIDRGEAEAIVQARERKVGEVLIDEKKGRLIAERHSLSAHGLLGILKEFKRNGLIDEVRPLIAKLKRDLAYRIDERLLKKELAEIGEV